MIFLHQGRINKTFKVLNINQQHKIPLQFLHNTIKVYLIFFGAQIYAQKKNLTTIIMILKVGF